MRRPLDALLSLFSHFNELVLVFKRIESVANAVLESKLQNLLLALLLIRQLNTKVDFVFVQFLFQLPARQLVLQRTRRIADRFIVYYLNCFLRDVVMT